MRESIEINKRYFSSLSKIFSPIVINDLISFGRSDYLNEVVYNSNLLKLINKSLPLSEFFNHLYKYLSRHYCNEYIYKNVIAKQLYLGKHFETSNILTEFRVADCKADLVILNGTSSVYEIKSEFDSFDRLDNQISAYSKVFDYINVISSRSQIEWLRNNLLCGIGIMALNSKNEIQIIREPQSNKKKVVPSIIFNSLRKNEYLEIIKEHFNFIPDVPNTQIYNACLKFFSKLSPNEAHDAMLKQLCKRNNSKLVRDFINNAPDSLKAYAISSNTTRLKINKLTNLLDQSIESIISPVVL